MQPTDPTDADPVVVLGANGRLGQALRRIWATRPDVFWQSRLAGADIRWAPGGRWPGPPRVRAIVALWGVVPGKGDPMQNVRLALAAMDLGAALGAQRVLHCSSAAVYSPAPAPWRETQSAPASPYGKSKRMAERAVADWCRERRNGPASCMMRIGNVAGADSLFDALNQDKPLRIHRFGGGGGPLRSYIDHASFARVVDTLLTCPGSVLPDIVNVANGGVIDMADIARAAGRDPVWNAAPSPALDRVELDLTRLRRLVDPGKTNPAKLLADAAALAQVAQ